MSKGPVAYQKLPRRSDVQACRGRECLREGVSSARAGESFNLWEFVIMEHTKELLSVPLSSLVPSPLNVRRHSAGGIEELAALIESQGLLHNLVVTEQVAGRARPASCASRWVPASVGGA